MRNVLLSVGSLMAVCCSLPLGAAFVTPSSVWSSRVATTHNKPTSTTLYYRDDVPPIGSTPTWETPNDFHQFVTQCSIQSFMFLLDSLRDDITVQWLNDFTDPVLQSNSNATATSATVASETTPAAAATSSSTKPAPKKVSLEQAALSALANTEQLMTDAVTEGSKKKKKKAKRSKKTNNKKNEPSLSLVDEKSATPKTALASKPKQKKKKTGPVSTSLSKASLGLLSEQAAMKTSFSSFSKMMKVASKDEPDEYQDMSPKNVQPASNTDISALYSPPFSRIPTKQAGATAGPKNSFAPYSPKKPTTSRPTAPAFSGGSTSVPKAFTSASASTSTSALYGTPEKKAAKASMENTQKDAAVTEKDTTAVTATQRKKKVLRYHGLAILNCTKFPTWDAYFEVLLDQPKEHYTIESFHPNGPSYDLDIDPASLCRRMLSVRTKIAEEFEHDLEVIANMGELTMMSYHKMQRELREQRGEEKMQKFKDSLEKQIPKSMEESISSHNGATATDDVDATKPQKPSMQRANLLFLDSAVAKPGADNADYAPSPLRKGNFDLLVLLATQEAIHRVLNDPSRQARKSAEHGSNQFLQDFYVTRLLSHFSGDQRYGRADDFLEEMLATTPRMITADPETSASSSGTGEKDGDDAAGGSQDELTKDVTYLVDPVKVAETILNVRDKVALEWKEQLEKDTKEAHMAIQKLVLAKVMGGTTEECKVVDPVGNDLEGDGGTESCFE